MDQNNSDSQTLFPHETGPGHHRSARERQRKGPMWGCLRAMLWLFAGGGVVLVLVLFAIPWIIQTAYIENVVRQRVEKTLEQRLNRNVTIGRVEVLRAGWFRPTKAILHDLRIANAPGAVSPYFATVKRLEISGGLGSFRTRTIDVGRIDVIGPAVNFEIYPEGSALTHNFPQWKSGPRSRYEIVRIEFDRMYVRGGSLLFLDRRHQITAQTTDFSSDITITRAEGLYAGVMSSPVLQLRIQDYEPLDLDLRGEFRYTPGILALNSIALRGRGVETFVSGKLEPLTEGVYDLRVTSQIALERIREIFRVDRTLGGTLSLDTRLTGRQGDFRLAGGWVSPAIVADTYELTAAEGTLDVTGQGAVVNVKSAQYGGGSVSADYRLSQYGEPYPMNVALRYDGISVEKLFSDWGVEDTGLRAAATGQLTYRWNKDKVLDGAGEGSARLAKNAVAFSEARYPIPIAGSTDFTLSRGIVGFRRLDLDTDRTQLNITGTLRIDDIGTDWRVNVRSSDFSELDRLAYNFARSAGKDDFELLGLGGSGTIVGTVRGPIKTPEVAARVAGTGVQYNNVLLGAADIDLRYDGVRSVLTFDRAVFSDGTGRLAVTGTVAFPDRGPSPRFDIAVDAENYPVDRAVKAMDLDFALAGRGTGRLLVTGSPESGKVTFAGLTIRRAESDLSLRGDVAWAPGEGNVQFNLDIDAREFPVADIAAFFDFGEIPVAGDLTGSLHIEGPKARLEGSGAVTVRRGSIYGEPIDVASADITFTEGRLRATGISVSAPAGQITGRAELDLNTDQFSYEIASGSLDLSRLQLLKDLQDLFGGRLAITSAGGGTFENPELVLEATLNEATLEGLSLPPDAPPPSLYVAIRGGRLVIRGSAANVLSIEGDGAVGENLSVDGNVRITVSDVARLLALSADTATVPASGNFIVDLQLGGRLTPLDELIIEGSVPTLDLRVSEHELAATRPLRFSMRDGRVTMDDFEVQSNGSTFAVTGFAGVTGEKRLGIDLRGRIEAALLQLFMADVQAEGHLSVAVDVRGTVSRPLLTGSAELEDAQVAFAGFPQVIDRINGRLLFRGDTIDIESLRATVGGGTVFAGGSVVVDGLTPQRARITLKGQNVALRYFEGLTIEGNFDLLVSGDVERIVVQGDVVVGRALYFRDFEFQQALLNVILSRRGITPIVAASWQERVDLRIRMVANETLAVENNIADLTGSAEIELAGTLANPVILGTVDLDEGGTVTFQNVDYRLVRGTITFQNPFRIDPYFDVTLEGRVSSTGFSSEVESGPIELTVNITGTLDRITPTITSDPPASDITLFSLIGLGGLMRGSDAGGGPGAALVGRSFVMQNLISGLGSRILPFADSFTYDPGLLDTTGSGPEPRVTFEKRVSDNVRVLIVYNLTTHQSREVIEWLATRDWTLQLTRDEQQREYRVDARFRRRYPGQWTWGERGRGEPFLSFGTLGDGEVQAALVPPPPVTDVVPIPPDGAVSEVRFTADGGFDTSALEQYVTLDPGDPLTRREVQSTIKSLYSTGNFRDIRVDAEPGPDGTIVTFTLSLNYRVEEIDFDGLAGNERRNAERRLTIRLGHVLSLNAVDDSSVAIQEELVRQGYLEATVDPETTFFRERNAAGITFNVTTGPRARVATVNIEGQIAPFTPEQLIDRMREKPGAIFRIERARGDVERIKDFLSRENYRRAEVEFVEHVYDDATKTVSLRYRVNAGAPVRVEVTGVDRSAVRRLLPFRGDQAYSEDAIERASQDIVRTYQQRGHLNAAVDTESGMAGDTWVVTFDVKPGPRYRLTGVEFTGNVQLSDDELEDVVATAPRGGFRGIIASLFRRPTGVTREQISEDRDALESHYRLDGFSEAVVGAPVPAANADGTLVITFPITEGPQTLVSGVRLEGAEQVAADNLPRLRLKAGGPLNPQLLREDVVALQTFYANRGNSEVQIRERVVVSPDKASAAVSYVIAEGPRIVVDDVVVSGNTYTSSEVILRQANLEKGDAFSYTSILEAQQNLYRLGIFSRVDIQPEQSGTSVGDRDVAISVEEGRNLAISGSVGLRAERSATQGEQETSFRVAAGVAHRNLFGTGRYLGLETVGTTGGLQEQELFITYREPFIGRFNIPVQISIFQTDDATRKETRILQRGTSIEASKVSSYRTRWSIQYQYKISECLQGDLCADQDVIIPGIDRNLLDIQISSVTPTFFWDRRNDVINPTRGFFTSASVEYAFKLFSADSQFLKEFVQGAWYLPVSARTVVALSGRVGFIQPLGSDDPATIENERFIPLSERFTAGGDTSHRAYPLDLLGTLCQEFVSPGQGPAPPRGGFPGCQPTLVDLDGTRDSFRIVPLGGNALFLVNAEYRFPIFSSVGGAVFTDIGNVFANRIDFGELRYGAGVGVRYLSPVGPLRFDVGFPFNRQFYDRSFSYSITLGYPF
ncbi:MAG TPA: translocation/assembly module TamB domain-containing protein [Thermoanaerobaculia bacterium]|nr:translocation/assembly module TamB domain-containing protein [Thermoanaerobaculia bacterium]